MDIKYITTRFAFPLIAISLVVSLVAFGNVEAEEERRPLSEPELVSVYKPSVVRILKVAKGEADLPYPVINTKNKSVTFDEKNIAKRKFDHKNAASGFIVNPDGYVVTSAHVVSEEGDRLSIAEQYYRTPFTVAFFDEESEISDEEYLAFYNRYIEAVVARIKPVYTEKKVVVLNPKSTTKEFDKLFSQGFEAKVISAGDRFIQNEKDVAIIKIDQTGLPAIDIGNAAPTRPGENVYIFGYPSVADNDGLQTDSTFTRGVVNAIKDSQRKQLKMVQTDTLISPGSSGGPMLDSRGRVIAITTLGNRTFGFGIPATVAKEALATANIENIEGEHAKRLVAGIELFEKRYCKDAMREFDKARDGTNELFRNDSLVRPYYDTCETLIAEGESLDTTTARLIHWAKNLDTGSLSVAIAYGSTLLMAIAAILSLAKRLKKREKDLVLVEEALVQETAKEEGERELRTRLEKSMNGEPAEPEPPQPKAPAPVIVPTEPIPPPPPAPVPPIVAPAPATVTEDVQSILKDIPPQS